MKFKTLIEQIRDKAQTRHEYDHDHEWLDGLMSAIGEACGSADLKFEKPEFDCTTVAIFGNLSEGFTAYGPFASFDAAASFSNGQDESWIMTLKDPCHFGIPEGALLVPGMEVQVKHALATKNPCAEIEVGNDIGPAERRPKVECAKCGEFKPVAKMIDGFEICETCVTL